MSAILDLQKFCGDGEIDFRIGSPFNKGAWTYATNGHVIVRVALIPGLRQDGPDAERIFDAASASGELSALNIPKLPKVTITTEDCEKCDGSGLKHDCPACTCNCEECCGRGNYDQTSDKAVSVHINGVDFACEYIRLLGELSDLRIAEPQKEKPLRFTFNSGEGILMPLRSSRRRSIKTRERAEQ